MSVHENFPPNCVGYAYDAIGYKRDAFYDPEDVLEEFCEVPVEKAEIVVRIYLGVDGKSRRVDHVTPLPDNKGYVMHRPYTGAKPVPQKFEDAIGYWGKTPYDGLVYLRRKEE